MKNTTTYSLLFEKFYIFAIKYATMKRLYLHTANLSDACGGLGFISGFFIL